MSRLSSGHLSRIYSVITKSGYHRPISDGHTCFFSAHDKIRAFVSHGGLLGTQEAVYHGVPTIVMPLFAEQDYNAERIQSRGRGIRLEISQLTQAKFENAIREITSNET
jgi:UDP:flavonoid glycosyltransferase YjiC (YdhE family)